MDQELLKKLGISELTSSKNHYYYASKISIENIIEFLKTKDEELEEIKIKYVYTADCLNAGGDDNTIFDEVDEELSKTFNNVSDLIKHVEDYDGYFEMANIYFQYTEYYNDYDKRIAEIYCIRAY